MKNNGVIYILTNPSFKEWVKIGYADNVEERVEQLNRRETTPFAFRIYATYSVANRLQDITVHNLIDQLNPNLRSIENINGKTRVCEFYALSPEEAYSILEKIAKINGLESNLKLYKPTIEESNEEEAAEEVIDLKYNRHHFKEITFKSSLTGKEYYTKTDEDGLLVVLEKNTNNIVPNFSNPSKKQIIRTALSDLGYNFDNSKTLYQLMHELEKIVING